MVKGPRAGSTCMVPAKRDLRPTAAGAFLLVAWTLTPHVTAAGETQGRVQPENCLRAGTSFPVSLICCCCVNMAVPKAIRYLAGATVCLLVYLFLQMLDAPQTEIRLPSTKLPLLKHGEWDHDPQRERKTHLSLLQGSHTDALQHPASLSGPSDESTATTTHRTAPTARASMPRYSAWCATRSWKTCCRA
jgi:hypothetical protein